MLEVAANSGIGFAVLKLKERLHLISYLASMMRQYLLQKGYEQKVRMAAPQELGRRLGDKCKSVRHFSASFWLTCWIVVREKPLFTREFDSAADLKNTYRDAVGFALNLDPDAMLPLMHKCSAYEGPLIVVLMVVYRELGTRFAAFSQEDIDSATYGYANKAEAIR